jgi:flagellar FliJ protein
MIREYKEFEAKLKMAHVLQEMVKLDIEIKSMQKIIEESMISSYKRYKSGDKIDFSTESFNDDYIKGLTAKISINENMKIDLDIKLKKLKEEYFEARKQRKIIDELKKREFKTYKDEAKKQEIKRLDEISGQFYMRENKKQA